MTLFQNPFSGISQSFYFLWVFLSRGGWAVFVAGLLYMLFILYRNEIRTQWVLMQDWVFLQIKIPRENIVSLLSVEQIFAQLHTIHENYTFAETWVEGKTQLWYALEIVSLGGKISLIVRCAEKVRNMVEAAFYAQYPEAEITRVEDYMAGVHYDHHRPENNEFEIWGTEMTLTEKQYYPIKTYKDFEHQTHPEPEEKIIDPIASLFEGLAALKPHEFYGVQILIRPLADEQWKPKAELLVKELIGEEVPGKFRFRDIFLKPFNLVAGFSFKSLLGAPNPHAHHARPEGSPKNDVLYMTEVQKQRVALVEGKMGKTGYHTKIRLLYLAPKDKFDRNKRTVGFGPYRPLSSANTNKLKPDVKEIWTNVNYRFSPTLERPYLDWVINQRKHHLLKAYKNRDMFIGLQPFILNVEEIATVFHLPIATDTGGVPLEKLESKKVQPPSNLPIGDESMI